MGISLAKSELVSLGLTTFLYGLFFALFWITLVVMSWRVTEDVRVQRSKIMPVSFLMLVVATMHLTIIWVRAVQGFIAQKGGSATAYYENIAEPLSLVKLCCLLFQSLLGDGVIIWRLYVVYGKRTWIIVPAILLVISYTVVGCITLWFISRAHIGTNIFHVATSWITAYFSLTMSTNVVCSGKSALHSIAAVMFIPYLGAIAWRIFLAGKPLRSTRTLWPVIFVIVESSALYALGVIAVLASFLSGSNGQYAAVDAIVPLVGIVFSLIVLQIRFHVSATAGPRSDGQLSTGGGAGWARQHGRPAGGDDLSYPLRSIQMAVHVTHTQVTSGLGEDRHDTSSEIDKHEPF
ncbi:hypothetical protein BC834DRAFT_37029 [Gloeopeniophorella convolvens]|nr:hypothetical protein BC834DRAFT_37029 [Gloeopeniophorella convolvens]